MYAGDRRFSAVRVSAPLFDQMPLCPQVSLKASVDEIFNSVQFLIMSRNRFV